MLKAGQRSLDIRVFAGMYCMQVDIVGEGDDFLSDDSDLNEPEDRQPRRTRFRWSQYPRISARRVLQQLLSRKS